MSALPPTELIPAPQLMSVGFSLAGVVSAQDNAAAAIRQFANAAAEVRAMFAALRRAVRAQAAPQPVNATQIRAALDKLLEFERALREAAGNTDRLLADAPTLAERFGTEGAAELRRFRAELGNDFIPLLRELRLQALCFVAERAQAAGVDVLDLPPDFAQFFRSASLAETEAWQETAWLLADVEDASRLSQSMASVATDRTDALASPDDRSVP